MKAIACAIVMLACSVPPAMNETETSKTGRAAVAGIFLALTIAFLVFE